MQTPSTGWDHTGQVEYSFVIDGVEYGPESEVDHVVKNELFPDVGIGHASCATLNLTIYADSIPRGAKIERRVRSVNGNQVSEWVPKGTFWVNKRPSEDGLWFIEAYDAMMRADRVWEPDQSLVFPMPMLDAVNVIAGLMGVSVDERTLALIGDYTIDYPTSEQTLRQTLCWIAAANGGNFIISDAGALRLVDLGGELNNWGAGFHEIYQDVASYSDNGKRKPISRVTLWLDDEHCLTAGEDNGLEIEADCPYATKEMVENILYYLEGYEYQAYEANAATISPLVELGDRVLSGADGSTVVSFVAAKIVDDGSLYPDIAAPGEAELEDEYPFEGPWTQQFNRKIAKTQSLISKSADEIRLEVFGEDGYTGTALQVMLDGVVVTTTNEDGTKTITLRDGIVTADAIAAGAITAEKIAAGAISADSLDLTDAITFKHLSDDLLGTINDAYSMAEDAEYLAGEAADVVSGWRYGDTTYIDGAMIKTGTVMASELLGGSVGLLNEDEDVVGEMGITGASTSDYAIDLTSYGALRLTAEYGALYLGNETTGKLNFLSLDGEDISIRAGSFYPTGSGADLGNSEYKWDAVYSYTGTIQTSDANQKNSIETLPEKYMDLVLWLEPKRYKLNNGTSGRYHPGFIAQDVKTGMDLFGIDSLEFGGWCKDTDANGNDIYMLRYEEFIAPMLAAIQAHEARLKKLEGG